MQSETSESTWFYEALAWLELNKKRVIIGAIAILALIVLIYVYGWYRGETELAASRALLALRTSRVEPGSPPAAGSADFLKIAEEYRSTSAGERALLLAAGNLFAEGKYAEAKTRFDEFLQRYGGSSLAAVAALGSASSLDAQDKLDDALAAYQRVVNQYSNDPAAQRARLAIATLHEAKNQPELAFKVLDELSKQPGAGSAVMEAAARKERLEKRYPNVTFTNTAVLPATAAGLQSATTVLPVVPKAGAAATPGSATNAPLGPAK